MTEPLPPAPDPAITFATCWYPLRSKFPSNTYLSWMDNFLSQVRHFYLVIFTDEAGAPSLRPYETANPERIRIVIKPLHDLRGYKWHDFWEKNHAKNRWLNQRTEWPLTMLWCEKVHFVANVLQEDYFPATDFYGWCDIGYFRCRPWEDLPKSALVDWAHPDAFDRFRPTGSAPAPSPIYYALVNNHPDAVARMHYIVNARNSATGIPSIPPDQVSVAGGFFFGHRDAILPWEALFSSKLAHYVRHGALVKDDQIIVADCVFSFPQRFELLQEYAPPLDNWFLFQRVLQLPRHV